MNKLMRINCDSSCGFSVQGRNANEIVKILTNHAKIRHHMANITGAEVRKMIRKFSYRW